jgi:hypothetical protein
MPCSPTCHMQTGKTYTLYELFLAILRTFGMPASAAGQIPPCECAAETPAWCAWRLDFNGYNRRQGLEVFQAALLNNLQRLAKGHGFEAAANMPHQFGPNQDIQRLLQLLPSDRVHFLLVGVG